MGDGAGAVARMITMWHADPIYLGPAYGLAGAPAGSIFPRTSRRVFAESLAVVALALVFAALVLLAVLAAPGPSPRAPDAFSCLMHPDLAMRPPACWAAN